MGLSKIYRGAEGETVTEFHFRSFGEVESPAVKDAPQFAAQAAPAGAKAAVPDGAPAVNLPKLLEEAKARGRQEGLALAEERFESTTRALAGALEEVSRLRESLAQNGSQDMLRLVMAVAEQIVRRSVEINPQVVLTVIETALQASVRADSYRLSISPEDLEVVKAQKPLFLASISGLKNLSIDVDASISRGGCRVDSELGDVDATIETQLDSIRQALAAAILES
ncbi:MAG TPA: flagellar assembly protein FliH [Malonomonas sp.]